MLSHAYNNIINCSVVSPGHVKDFVDYLRATYKILLTMLMITVQLPGTTTNNSYMDMHTVMSNTCISLARVFQKNISYRTCAHRFIYHRKDRKISSKCKWTDR